MRTTCSGAVGQSIREEPGHSLAKVAVALGNQTETAANNGCKSRFGVPRGECQDAAGLNLGQPFHRIVQEGHRYPGRPFRRSSRGQAGFHRPGSRPFGEQTEDTARGWRHVAAGDLVLKGISDNLSRPSPNHLMELPASAASEERR